MSIENLLPKTNNYISLAPKGERNYSFGNPIANNVNNQNAYIVVENNGKKEVMILDSNNLGNYQNLTKTKKDNYYSNATRMANEIIQYIAMFKNIAEQSGISYIGKSIGGHLNYIGESSSNTHYAKPNSGKINSYKPENGGEAKCGKASYNPGKGKSASSSK